MIYQLDGNRRLVLNDEVLSVLRSINHTGNNQTEVTNTIGKWQLPSNAKRCERNTLWKLNNLLVEGIPPTPLFFTVCRDQAGKSHAVLCVSTNQGDLVMDCNYGDVVSYDRVKEDGYRILYRTTVGSNLDDLWSAIEEYK